MATTFVERDGDGDATKEFSFPSLQQSDIKVSVDNVLKTVSTHYNITDYSQTGGGKVVFTSGNIPSSGTIRIFRDTDVDTAKATYVAGSSITALDLNDNHKQSLFKLQEQSNTTFSTTDQTKLNSIETGATADQTASEIRTLVESASDSNVFTDADHAKLNAIESSADVTDATNVDAAGAVMNSDTSTAAMSFVVDEDNMSSNSATKVPTQQSVKAYVDTEVAGVVDSAPGALDTLNELAAALADDANFSTTVTNSIATKLPLAGGTLTGDVTFTGDSANIVFDKSDNALEFADDAKLVFGDGGDVNIRHDGARTMIRNHGIGPIHLDLLVGGNAFVISKANIAEKIAEFTPDGSVALYHGIDSSSAAEKKIETTSWGSHVFGSLVANGDIKVNKTTGKLIIGTGNEFSINHNSSNLFIENTVGDIHIRPKASEEGIKLIPDGSVELYHDNEKKLETVADGVDAFNRLRCLGGSASIHLNSDATGANTSTRAMFGLASGNNHFISGAGAHDVVLNTPHRFLVGHASNEIMAIFDPDGSVELYHDNGKKLETTSSGVTVTGSVTATSFVGDGAVTINNNGTSKVITGSGTANTLNANVNLTFDGTTLDVKSGTGVINTGNINTGGVTSTGDVYTSNKALIAHDAAGANADRTGNNIDHIWHEESNSVSNTGWNFVSDGTYRQKGNANINVGSINGNSFTTFKYYEAKGDGTTDDSTAVTNALATGNIVNGDGKIYVVTSLPTDFKNIRNAAFKIKTGGTVNNTIYPTKDFLTNNTAKITNNRAYTAWTQDKAYVVNNQIKVWSNFGDAHYDGIKRPICFISDDGGNSYPETTLLDDPSEETLEAMSAGTDGIYEYVFATKYPNGTQLDDSTVGTATNPKKISHLMYRRPVAVERYEKDVTTSISSNTITLTNHGYGTGLKVKYTGSTLSAEGNAVTSGTSFFVVRVNANTFKLASTLKNAESNTTLAISSSGSFKIDPDASTYQRWQKFVYAPAWANDQAYEENAIIQNSSKLYQAQAAISSGGSAPTHSSGTTNNWKRVKGTPLASLPNSPFASSGGLGNVRTTFQHSFAAGNGYIVTGATNGAGAFILYSNDHGLTWNKKGLKEGTNFEEPTVRYDSGTSNFYAFTRAGDTGGQIVFYVIPHALNTTNLSSSDYHEAGTFFDPKVIKSPVPFVIKDGYVHAFLTERGTNDDPRPDSFYVKYQLSNGSGNNYNIWAHAELYNIGSLLQLEKGSSGSGEAGASGTGVGSACVYEDKIIFFYSSEERSQSDISATSEDGIDKIVNLYQFVLGDKVKHGATNYKDNLIEDRSSAYVPKLIPNAEPDGKYADPSVNTSGDTDRQTFWHQNGNHIFSTTRSFSDSHLNSRTDSDFGGYTTETGKQLAAFDSFNEAGEVSIFGDIGSGESLGFTVYNTDNGGGTGFLVNNDQSLDIISDGGAAKVSVNTSGEIKIPDNGKLLFGAGDGTYGDLEIYHDSSQNLNFIDCPADAGTAHLIIKADDFFVQGSNGEQMIKAIENSGVELFWNHQSKFYTREAGVVVTGSSEVSGGGQFGGNVTAPKIGLGTETNPSHPLDIKSAENTLAILESTDRHTYIEMHDSVGNVLIGTDSGHFRLRQYANNNYVETIRINQNGNVGIGTISPSSKVEIKGSSATHQLVSINRPNSDVAALYIGNNSSNQPIIAANNNDLLVGRDNGGTFTEYYRVNNSDGHIQIHQSTSTQPGGGNTVEGACFNRDSDDGTCLYLSKTDAFCLHLNRINSGDIQVFRRQGIQKGQIDINASRVAYETTSDYRLKENVVSISDGISKLKALKPSRFNFKEDPTNTIDGFLAHEVQTVVPNAVSGTKDGVDENGDPKYQGMDSSLLVPLLTAALQEAVAKIETLETKVAALEAA